MAAAERMEAVVLVHTAMVGHKAKVDRTVMAVLDRTAAVDRMVTAVHTAKLAVHSSGKLGIDQRVVVNLRLSKFPKMVF